MAEDVLPAPDKPSWRFPGTFWIANGAELCERAAYYGMFITLVRYLNEMVGFSDVRALTLAGLFSSILYLLPTFMGIMADKIGFKRALMLAFALLTAGYALLGLFQFKITAVLALVVIMFGGAVIKPVISGTAAKSWRVTSTTGWGFSTSTTTPRGWHSRPSFSLPASTVTPTPGVSGKPCPRPCAGCSR
jgi:dipeptide/tripeptide permease